MELLKPRIPITRSGGGVVPDRHRTRKYMLRPDENLADRCEEEASEEREC